MLFRGDSVADTSKARPTEYWHKDLSADRAQNFAWPVLALAVVLLGWGLVIVIQAGKEPVDDHKEKEDDCKRS